MCQIFHPLFHTETVNKCRYDLKMLHIMNPYLDKNLLIFTCLLFFPGKLEANKLKNNLLSFYHFNFIRGCFFHLPLNLCERQKHMYSFVYKDRENRAKVSCPCWPLATCSLCREQGHSPGLTQGAGSQSAEPLPRRVCIRKKHCKHVNLTEITQLREITQI